MRHLKSNRLLFIVLFTIYSNGYSQFHLYSFDLVGPVKSMKVSEYRLNDDGSINYDRDNYTDQYYLFAKSGYITSSYEESNRSWEEKNHPKYFSKMTPFY
jgi:hypothetical protein